MSEKLRTLQVEECKCCNLEAVEEKSRLLFAGHDPEPAQASDEEELRWQERVTSVTNLTYLSPLTPPLLDSPVPKPTCVRNHGTEDSGPNSSDYVTSMTM